MKNLYLLRHAKSDWSNPGENDFERTLNKRGKKDAPLIGAFIKKLEIPIELIISSPAIRAKSTALQIAEKSGLNKEEIHFFDELYNFNHQPYLSIIQSINDDLSNILLVAHNPALEQLSAYLSGTTYDAYRIPTCGFLHFNIDVKNWKDLEFGCGNLRWMVIPRMLNTIM